MQLKQSWIEKFLIDPVMAAWVIMGIELDVFQQARLRIYWWVPEVVDSSGVSSGKTIVDFAYVNLRCILIEDHVAGIYFPNFQTMKDEFWPYFQRFMDGSEIFRQQFEFHHGKYGEHKYPGAYVMDYKNRSKLVAPAPSFMSDSQTQASRRFNTLVVDDWLRAEDMGEGISKQLVDRVTRPCFNQNHPIWENHLKFLGHAERPSHKGYVRVKAYKRAITDGSQSHALISFCYKDMTPEFAKRYRPDKRIASQRKVLSKDQFDRQWGGIWSRDGAAYYPETILHRQCRAYLIPAYGRIFDNEYNFGGFDFAPAQSRKSDANAGVIYRLVEINEALKQECYRKKIELPPVTLDLEALGLEAVGQYNCAFTFATIRKNLSAGQLAAMVHWLHRVFGFVKIGFDPGGGGLFVYKEVMKDKQIINNAETRVIPICTKDEAITVDKQPILTFFKRGTELDDLLLPQQLTSDEGFIEAVHMAYNEAWQGGYHHWPLPMEDRAPSQVKQWNNEQVWAQRFLDAGLKQLANVRQVTTKDGRVATSKRGFTMFEAKGRKDVAYASLYARTVAWRWLKDREEDEEEEESGCIAVG